MNAESKTVLKIHIQHINYFINFFISYMCTPWRAEEGARFSGTGVLADKGLGTKHRPLRKQ